jgi:hypothetical protein
MRQLRACLIALGSMLCAVAVAAEPPALVAESIAEASKTCTDVGGKPAEGAGFATVRDLDGNGVEDWVLDFERFECDGAASLFCGTGGCTLEIYLGRDGTWQKVFADNVRSYKLVKRGKRPAIAVSLHGSACGRAGVHDCPKTFLFANSKLVPAR